MDQLNKGTSSFKEHPGSHVRRFFAELGPGLITGAADDDPSGISTYSVTGAAFGFAQLWTVFFAFPLMIAVQIMLARLARRSASPGEEVLRRAGSGGRALGCVEFS